MHIVTSPDALEECSEQRVVVYGLLGGGGASHGGGDDGGEVRSQHGLVVGEERDGAKHEFKETQEGRRLRWWLKTG